MQPHHHHDCHNCEFLGATPGERGPVDYYVCKGSNLTTYLARYSSDGPDYSSESVFTDGPKLPVFDGPLLAYMIHQATQAT